MTNIFLKEQDKSRGSAGAVSDDCSWVKTWWYWHHHWPSWRHESGWSPPFSPAQACIPNLVIADPFIQIPFLIKVQIEFQLFVTKESCSVQKFVTLRLSTQLLWGYWRSLGISTHNEDVETFLLPHSSQTRCHTKRYEGSICVVYEAITFSENRLAKKLLTISKHWQSLRFQKGLTK